jgi:hypothetical protein
MVRTVGSGVRRWRGRGTLPGKKWGNKNAARTA